MGLIKANDHTKNKCMIKIFSRIFFNSHVTKATHNRIFKLRFKIFDVARCEGQKKWGQYLLHVFDIKPRRNHGLEKIFNLLVRNNKIKVQLTSLFFWYLKCKVPCKKKKTPKHIFLGFEISK